MRRRQLGILGQSQIQAGQRLLAIAGRQRQQRIVILGKGRARVAVAELAHHLQGQRLVINLAEQRGHRGIALLLVLADGRAADRVQQVQCFAGLAVAQQRQRQRLPRLIIIRRQRLPVPRQAQGGGVILDQQRQQRSAFDDLRIAAGHGDLLVVFQRHIELLTLASDFRRQNLIHQLRAFTHLQRRANRKFALSRRLCIHHGRAAAQQQAAQTQYLQQESVHHQTVYRDRAATMGAAASEVARAHCARSAARLRGNSSALI